MAKGVMFSLSLVFLAALIITISLLIFRTSLSSEERATELSITHRVYDLDQSLHMIIRQLLATTTGASFTATNRSVHIVQDFPLSNFSSFNTSLRQLQTFVEADDPAIRFTLYNLDQRPFQILPYLMNYTRPDNRTIRITPTTLDYNAYTFHFFITNKPVGTITWDKYDAGTFPLTIISENATTNLTSTRTIDLSEDVALRLHGISTGTITINIDGDDQVTTLTTALDVPVRANTTIAFTSGTTRPFILYPALYTINFPAFNLTKHSGVALTTW